MFGNIKTHYKKLSAFGSKVAHKVTQAYGHGVKLASAVSHDVDYGRKLYDAASPFLHEMMGGRAKNRRCGAQGVHRVRSNTGPSDEFTRRGFGKD